MPAKGIHSTSASGFDVAVIGGGVIGLSVAWRARSRGLSVLVLDRGELGGGTSRVAAGMLAPASEADAQERALLALGLESARLWPPFAAELHDVSGLDVGLRTQGTLAVARDADEKRCARTRAGPARRASACVRPGCCPAQRARSSRRWRRASASASSSPTTIRPTRAR